MARLAALDLGSNSFHLLVADERAGGRIKRVATEKLTLRLAEPVTRTGALGAAASQRAERAFATLLQHARDAGAEQVIAVATEALRRASDGEALRTRLRERHGVPIQLLTGLDEAALSLRGMVAALNLSPGERILGLDLGGGSYELVYGDAGGVIAAASLQLGAGKLRDRLSDPPRFAELAELRSVALALIGPAADKIRAAAGDEPFPPPVVATAGTIRDLGRLGMAMAAGRAPEKVRGLVITRDQLEAAFARLCSVPTDERMDLPGVSEKRADLLPAGGTVLLTTFEAFDLPHVQLCDWGLREGALLDVLGDCTVVEHARLVPLH